MNESIKNVFSFIKEAMELNNKNIYDVRNYPSYYDLGSFYEKYKDLVDSPDFSNINILSDSCVFKLKYIKEESKKKYPVVPEILKEYVYLNKDNKLIDKVDNLDELLEEDNDLNKAYLDYSKELNDVDNYNELINNYNNTYMDIYNVYKRINDLEEKIEVVLGTNLLYWRSAEGNTILRHALEASLDINVDPMSNTITLTINNDKTKGFVYDFTTIDSFKTKDYGGLVDFTKEFNSFESEEDIDLTLNVRKFMNYLSLENEMVDSEFKDNSNLKNNCLYAFNNIGIIVRKKNVKLWIDDLDKIVDACDQGEFNSAILNLFEIDFNDDNQVREVLDDKTYEDTKDKDVLFPLPSNDEQYQIVDKVKRSNIVLVQGPPGTGKSHTIANLISHYVSEGKKVIVTSEKAKALEVLRDKIPEEIRSLSLALLSNTGIDKDLQFSVENILKNNLDEAQQNKIFQECTKLSSKLKEVQKEKGDTLTSIIDLMSKDTVSHREDLNSIMNFDSTNNMTLMDLAIWLDKHKEYNVISENDIENYNYSNLKDFFERLDNIADSIKQNKYAINGTVPLNDILNSNEIELSIQENIQFRNYIPRNNDMMNAVRKANINQSSLSKFKDSINSLSVLYNISDKKTLYDNSSYPVFRNQLTKIIDIIDRSHNFNSNVEEKMLEYIITYPEDKADIIHENLKNIISLYGDSDKLNLINKIAVGKYLKEIESLRVNGNLITKDNVTKGLAAVAVQRVFYDKEISDLQFKLKQLLGYDLFEMLHINKSQFGRYEEDVLKILNSLLNFKTIIEDIEKQFDKLVNTNLYKLDYISKNDEEIESIMKDLDYYLVFNMNQSKSNNFVNDLREYYKDYNLQGLNSVLVALSENDISQFIHAKNELLKEINIINSYNNLKSEYEQFMTDKEKFISDYIYIFDNVKKAYVKDNLDDILKYHYINKFYLTLEKAERALPKLFEKRDMLQKEEKEIIKELVTKKGWYYQSKYMNNAISLSLNKWMNLKKKLGAGTGRRSNLLLNQMRKEMVVAKNAIPVWIMPIDKLIEQYPYDNEAPFDVLIMDESSQSSVFSISALTRAKKVIIVGDDKQISPTNAFTDLEDIDNLRLKYLKNNPWDLQISKDTSIYDIVQTICGNKKVVLTEHFRCLPEIINYSNKEFYNMEINPLKVRGVNETIDKPIRTVYVPNARTRKIGSKPYNETEINRIVDLVGEIANDSQYDDKTIGIIALQNSNRYIQKIIELLMTRFGEQFIKDRKIKVGNTYDFQGDERDVIILGMVISPIDEKGEKYMFRALTTKEYDKSFNVAASRAKEQMILVHSIKLEEINNPKCNRYRLLNYCLNYNSDEEQEKEKLFESSFERDVFYVLDSKGFKLTPQFKVGKYRLDFVIENDKNQKIVIECDGDRYHGIDQLENDLERQTVLERCGWKFVRVRASEFYYDREKSVEIMVKKINNYLNNMIG